MSSDERGSASLLAVGVALLLLGAGLVGALWAAVSLGSHRATSAADLAALSAAQAVQSGAFDPCASARRIAADQQVELRECAVEGELVSVTVAVRLELGAIGSPAATAEARAGPIDRRAGTGETGGERGGGDWVGDG
ncbi:MAG TPA: Rv3654c family TadE-like protein [Kribbella sp.]|uniref:Rv3654c family TadE-like protein n=1 Tax=Kribbella sp. TaxID=1871183 RepID=UPI002D7901B9|nr:Rv3654c family TadE-like protein [Kribbella sp.]HET6296825.1 Rv3654c family TadE-like protein [Kribbella sp.]